MNNEDNLLKFGDCIILTTKQGFVQAQGFITKPQCFVQCGYRESQVYQRNMRDFVFQVMPRMQYDAFREYDNFKAYFEKAQSSSKPGRDEKGVSQQDKFRMIQLLKKLNEEIETNNKIFERRKGEKVQYGNEVQLLHYDSQCYLEGTKTSAELDKSCNLLKLNPQGSKFVCFVVEPRYKYRNHGQSVNYCDVVIFKNMKTGQFLHTSDSFLNTPVPINKECIKAKNPAYKSVISEKIDRRMLPEEFAALYEVNTSTSRNKFTIRLFRGWLDDFTPNFINGAMIVRLQHSESGAYLCADEHDYTGTQQPKVILWNYKGKSTDIEAASTHTLFELEIVNDVYASNGMNCSYSGNISNEQTKTHGGMQFRLRHLNTGRLVVKKDMEINRISIMSIALSSHLPVDLNPVEKGIKKIVSIKCTDLEKKKEIETSSIFRLVSTGVDIDNRIKAETSVQIQHVASQRYLCHETKIKPHKPDQSQNDISVGSISQTGYIYKEDLDYDCYKEMDEALLSQGNTEILSLDPLASYENAFFIIPEQITSIKNVLYVHCSVNMLNSFLDEVTNQDYGVSKERQKRIEGVMKDILFFLDEKEIQADEEEQAAQLDAPFGKTSDDVQFQIYNRKLLKQKICRELRVIEVCVDILHAPFASGAFKFKMLQPEQPILILCKLSYQLLSLLVDSYQLNELYASQWMSLYLQHVLQTNTDNQIGADSFVTQLVGSNKIVLQEQITSELVENFIMKSERSSESERLLRLLTALCSCQGEAQPQNQKDIIRVLLSEEEARNKFLMPLRREKRSDLEICLDLRTKQYNSVLSESKRYAQLTEQQLENGDDEEFKFRPQDATFFYNYKAFLQLMNLLAECCLGRNEKAQSEIGVHYQNKHLITIYQEKKFNFQIRSRCLGLFVNMYLDREPFTPLILPSENIVWNDMKRLEIRGNDITKKIIANEWDFDIKKSPVRIPTTLKEQKKFCCEYLKETKGVIMLTDIDKNEMTLQVLRTVLYMINHGFYEKNNELKELAQPIILILNGSTDNYKTIKFSPVLGTKPKKNVERYYPTKLSAIIIKCKSMCCDILLRILALEVDSKALMFIQKLKQDIEYVGTPSQNTQTQKLNKNTQNYVGKDIKKVVPQIEEAPAGPITELEDLDLLEAISQTKGFESVNENEYLCILFDLMLYRSPDLTKRVFALLVSYFTRRRTLIEAMTGIKILETSKSIQTMNKIKSLYLDLFKLKQEMQFWLTKNTGTGLEQKMKCTETFRNYAQFCIYKKKEEYDEDQNTTTAVDKSQFDTNKKSQDVSQLPVEQDAHGAEKKDDKEVYILFDVEVNKTKPNKENQRLLQGISIVPIALTIIKQRVDRVTSFDPAYIKLINQSYQFLIAYVRDNPYGQNQVYDDIDVFMRDIEKYSIVSLLLKEIFKNNRQFLTLNVGKFIRQIVSTSEEVALQNNKKAMYLKLLEVFCRFEDKLIKQNQSDIIIQMTADTSRSNVLYLFQAEGAKELGTHINNCIEVVNNKHEDETPGAHHIFDQHDMKTPSQIPVTPNLPGQHTLRDSDHQDGLKKSGLAKPASKVNVVTGFQTMNVPVFNVIQLLNLITLCCQGTSDVAQKRSKDLILSFKSASNIIYMASDFWPLKIAIFEYLSYCYIDGQDRGFLAQQNKDEKDDDMEEGDNDMQKGQDDISVLLKLVENLNLDFESYLAGGFKQTIVNMPNGEVFSMKQLGEEFLFFTGMKFIRFVLKRKTYDVGSVELKFYVIAKNVAALFYCTQKKENKMAVYDLLHYIFSSDRHSKYLDNVKHPAKKSKQSREMIEAMCGENESQAQEMTSVTHSQASGVQIDISQSKSSRLTSRINLIVNHEVIKDSRSREFTDLVTWIVLIEKKLEAVMANKKGSASDSGFGNVNYRSIMTALLGLMDARVLTKDLQMAGLTLIRKIIEVENKQAVTPAADWDSSEWTQYKRIIKIKQDSLVERGVVDFICKQITGQEDPEIQEECLLICNALVLGGNISAQAAFFRSMQKDEVENKFLITIKTLLQRNFDLTKKYLSEKNAKIEMNYRIKQRMQEELENNEDDPEQQALQKLTAEIVRANPDDDFKMLSVQLDDSQERVEEDHDQTKSMKKKKQTTSVDPKEKTLIVTIRVLRFMQLLTEGHYLPLQQHLREQKSFSGTRLSRSFDFVAFVSNMFGIYVKSFVNCYSTNLGNQIIECLVELIQGPCRQNQRVLVDTKAIDCCRDLLSQGMGNKQELDLKGFVGLRQNLLDDLKMSSVKLLLSILEGPVDEEISKRVSASLGDFEIVATRMQLVYEMFLIDILKIPVDSPSKIVQNSMPKDSFGSCIQEGFDIYSLLKQLAEVLPEDIEKLKKFEDQAYFKFYEKNNANIEIQTEFDLLRIFFPLQPVCRFLTKKTMEKFQLHVERESNQHKLLGLCEEVPSFIEEMEHLEIMSHQTIQITPSRLNTLRDQSTLLAIWIGVIILTQYKYEAQLQPDGSYSYQPSIDMIPRQIIFGLGCCQGVTALMLLVGFCVNKINLIVRAGWRQRVEKNEVAMAIEIKQIAENRSKIFDELNVSDLDFKTCRIILSIEGPYSPVFYNQHSKKRKFGSILLAFEYYWISLSFLISNGEFIFFIIYYVFSIQGLVQSPVFYSFHLLDVINRFGALQNVILAVTTNMSQLVLTAMLGVILIYIFACLAFLFISDNYFDSNIDHGLLNKSGNSVCMSLMHCFLSSINYGLRYGGGMGDYLPPVTLQDWNLQDRWIRFFFDVCFNMIISVICLNVIFGIIIDTFAQLREESSEREQDKKNICFICGLDRYILDRDTEEGFDFHEQQDHFIWFYLYFIIHINIKESSDYNGAESYIAKCLEQEDMVWFPQHKSLRLEQVKKSRENQDKQLVMGEGAAEEVKFDLKLLKCHELLTQLEAQNN